MLKCLCMCIPFHPHNTCVWGDIPKGLGMRVKTFKPSSEVLQASGEGTNHFHHVHHAWIIISTSWLLTNPTSFVIFRAFWPLNTCILQCLQFMAIWSCVSLKSTKMTEMLNSWISLQAWRWFPLNFGHDHSLSTRLIQHSLISSILLLFILYFLRGRSNHNWLSGLYKFHFFGDIGWWATPSDISQLGLVWEMFLRWNNIV